MIKEFSNDNLQDVNGGLIIKRCAEKADRIYWPYCTEEDKFVYDVHPDSLHETYDILEIEYDDDLNEVVSIYSPRLVFTNLKDAEDAAKRHNFNTRLLDLTGI